MVDAVQDRDEDRQIIAVAMFLAVEQILKILDLMNKIDSFCNYLAFYGVGSTVSHKMLENVPWQT